MPFKLQQADTTAISQVMITGNPSTFTLGPSTLQFPPKVLKDGKTANFKEQNAQSYEPFKLYSGSGPRILVIECQWVAGGQFPPSTIQNTLGNVKGYFYTGYLGSGVVTYPAVIITKLYQIINTRTSWRMTNLDITYSEELVQINSQYFPLHSKMTMSLESATQLGNIGGGDTLIPAANLESAPSPQWY